MRTRPVPPRGLLRTAAGLTTPLLPDDYLSLVRPLWSLRTGRAEVVDVRPETADAATLVLRPGWTWRPHRAGQWVRLGVRIDGVWHSRTYSLTSVRGASLVTVTVKALPGGRVSPYLVRELRPGNVVRLEPPQGDFVLPEPAPRRALFLTAGSGITPVMGMLRTLTAARERMTDVVHVHSALHRDDVIFGAELRQQHRRLPGYYLHEQHTDQDGFFAPSRLDSLCPDWRERETWACGPVGMLDDVEAHWRDRGVDGRLHVERFTPPVFAAPEADGGAVTFARTDRAADAPASVPLLEVGEQAGVVMPSGCRMGICFSCTVPLRSGQVRDLRTGSVHGEEGDLVQTCVSAAAGPCALDV